jgi:RNA polymerase sigma factor (sigma-70 family)
MKPFEQLVADHGPAILRVCRAVVGPDDADDAWSETFLSALRAYPELPQGSNEKAWLVTIAKRKAIDQHRRRARRPIPVATPPESPATPLPQLEETAELWEALEALPKKQREAIAYHYLIGLPYAQVGAILGNSEAAARRAAADGIKKFRSIYKRRTE